MTHRKTYRRNIGWRAAGIWRLMFLFLLSGFRMEPALASQYEGAGYGMQHGRFARKGGLSGIFLSKWMEQPKGRQYPMHRAELAAM